MRNIEFIFNYCAQLIDFRAEFKEFEPRLKYGWFHLKLYWMFQDFSWRSIETGYRGIWDVAQIHKIWTLGNLKFVKVQR